MQLLCVLILAFKLVFFLRLVLSFFPVQEGTLSATVREVSVVVTDPLVFPLRRRLPPLPGALAGFGVAELVLLIALEVIGTIICRIA